MGSVYEVEHVELGKRFVLKSLLRELARREDLAQRLRNEWRALARLQHPNIVNVPDAGTSSGCIPFSVMARLAGDTLPPVLPQKRRRHGLQAVPHTAAGVAAAAARRDRAARPTSQPHRRGPVDGRRASWRAGREPPGQRRLAPSVS